MGKYIEKVNFTKKCLTVAIVLLLIGIATVPTSINAYANKESYYNSLTSLMPLGWEINLGFLHPGITIYILNFSNETFQGNVSCKLIIDSTINVFGCSINITDFYVELEPQERILIYKGLILGFGTSEVVLDMPPPINDYCEFEGFLFFIFLFLKLKYN